MEAHSSSTSSVLSDSDSADTRDDVQDVQDDVQDVQDDEMEAPEVISLLDDGVFPDVLSMLAHCKEKHDFDFLALRQRLQLDFHGCVKLVNYIRQRVHRGQPVSEKIDRSDIEGDEYLKPILDDDAVILSLFDLPDVVPESVTANSTQDGALVADLVKKIGELQDEVARLTAQFASYRATVEETLDKRWGEVDSAETQAQGSSSSKAKTEDRSKYYWDSYAGSDIHETMLKDQVRTGAYRDFLYNNKHLLKGKTVLDIGCGTGILSMFAARAGAARVISVDASDIIDKARENVLRAGLSSTITLIKGKMEEVSLPVGTVDVIVSEWMGYCLLYEAMLPSVLFARDRYLAPGGLLLPSACNMWIAPVADSEYVMDAFGFWRDVYGFDMVAMQSGLWDDARVLQWPSQNVCGEAAGFKLLDLYTITESDLSFTARWTSTLTQDIDALDGFLVWFDIFFGPARQGHDARIDSVAQDWAEAHKDRVAFTTGPFGAETHWRQGVLLCKPGDRDPPPILKKGEVFEGEITFAPPDDMPRGLVMSIAWKKPDEDRTHSQSWNMR